MDGTEEHSLVVRCVEGDAEALTCLREMHHQFLCQRLAARGAGLPQTEDILADVWSECLPGRPDAGSLLEKYHGRVPLRAWLATVATHPFFDFKRREKISTTATEHAAAEGFLPAGQESLSLDPLEGALAQTLRQALDAAFLACPAETLTMLRLVHVHGVTQREVGRMWRWNESKVSRAMSSGVRRIREHTLHSLRKHDPWLHLTWRDVVEVCGAATDGIEK